MITTRTYTWEMEGKTGEISAHDEHQAASNLAARLEKEIDKKHPKIIIIKDPALRVIVPFHFKVSRNMYDIIVVQQVGE